MSIEKMKELEDSANMLRDEAALAENDGLPNTSEAFLRAADLIDALKRILANEIASSGQVICELKGTVDELRSQLIDEKASSEQDIGDLEKAVSDLRLENEFLAEKAKTLQEDNECLMEDLRYG